MTFTDLVVTTIRDPEEAAHRLMGWGLPRNALYEAVIAVAALNAILLGISSLLMPQPTILPVFFTQPFIYFVVMAGGLVIYANLLYWAGRAMGGTGDMGDILTLVVWLQGLRALAQILVTVLSFVIPALAALLGLVVSIYALYVLIKFIKAAHRFGSIMQSIGLLIVVSAGLIIALMMVLTLAGVSVNGVAPNV